MAFSMKHAVRLQERSLTMQEAVANMEFSCNRCSRLCRETSCPMMAAFERNRFIFSVKEGLMHTSVMKTEAPVKEWTILA